MVVTPACSLPLITWDSRSVAGWHYCCGSVWETRRWWQESTSVKCLCIQTHSLLHPHPLSSPLFRLTQQAYAVPVKFIVRNPQNYFLEKKKKRRRTERRARERLRVRAAGADECFWVCLEKRDWDEARACSLTSMDCSLGNVPANRVCVIVCVGPCVCVCMRATRPNSSPLQSWPTTSRLRSFDEGTGTAATTRFPQLTPRPLFLPRVLPSSRSGPGIKLGACIGVASTLMETFGEFTSIRVQSPGPCVQNVQVFGQC